jgi:hypothetical protein
MLKENRALATGNRRNGGSVSGKGRRNMHGNDMGMGPCLPAPCLE